VRKQKGKPQGTDLGVNAWGSMGNTNKTVVRGNGVLWFGSLITKELRAHRGGKGLSKRGFWLSKRKIGIATGIDIKIDRGLFKGKIN